MPRDFARSPQYSRSNRVPDQHRDAKANAENAQEFAGRHHTLGLA